MKKIGLIINPVADTMKKDTVYIIGGGTTTRAVMRELEQENTLIGVALVYNCDLVANDIYGQQILDLIGEKTAKLVITVTGGQGFLFGRGNQPLLVDTEDAELDEYLSGYHSVICDDNETIICKVCLG